MTVRHSNAAAASTDEHADRFDDWEGCGNQKNTWPAITEEHARWLKEITFGTVQRRKNKPPLRESSQSYSMTPIHVDPGCMLHQHQFAICGHRYTKQIEKVSSLQWFMHRLLQPCCYICKRESPGLKALQNNATQFLLKHQRKYPRKRLLLSLGLLVRKWMVLYNLIVVNRQPSLHKIVLHMCLTAIAVLSQSAGRRFIQITCS